MIPFSPPRMDQKVVDEVSKALLSGWITTGPRTKQFEKEIQAYTGSKKVICFSSATSGLELVLRWYGIQAGDERHLHFGASFLNPHQMFIGFAVFHIREMGERFRKAVPPHRKIVFHPQRIKLNLLFK